MRVPAPQGRVRDGESQQPTADRQELTSFVKRSCGGAAKDCLVKELLDHVVHGPQLLMTWSIFFGFGLLVYVFYVINNNWKFAFRELVEHCIPFNILTDQSFHADVKIYLIAKVIDGFIFLPGVLLNAWVSFYLSGLLKSVISFHPIEFTILMASICAIVMFLVIEFSDFVCHYAEHKIPVLWELHKVHHSAQFLNPLTAKRGHPLANVLEGIMRGILTGIAGGSFIFLFNITLVEAMSLSLVASKIFMIATLDPLKHSHHAVSFGIFDKLFISPHMHQIHHSKTPAHWDKNFGTNLSIFDWMIGTAYKPSRGEKAIYGISGYNDESIKKYNTLYGAYLSPLVNIYKKIKADIRSKYSVVGSLSK
jgi:sterol desaturase/sphingolipid hydroxylase (fatty acid hydroxylase superfamily)